MAQAFTGLLVQNGGGPSYPPRELGWTFSDVCGANAFYSAILAAIIARSRTGEGQLVQCSQVAATAYFQRQDVMRTLNNFAGKQRDDGKTPWQRLVFQQVAKAKDGKWICFSITKVDQLERLCQNALQRPDLLTNAILARWPVPRRDAADIFRRKIAEIIRTDTSSHWIKRLVESNVPCSPVSKYSDLSDPSTSVGKHMRKNEYIVDVTHRDFGPMQSVAQPAQFSSTPNRRVEAQAPNIGEDSFEILTGVLGYSSEQANELSRKGIVPLPCGPYAIANAKSHRIKYAAKLEDRRRKAKKTHQSKL